MTLSGIYFKILKREREEVDNKTFEDEIIIAVKTRSWVHRGLLCLCVWTKSIIKGLKKKKQLCGAKVEKLSLPKGYQKTKKWSVG